VRYLHEAEKAKITRELSEAHGLDEEIGLYLNQINSIDGICTTKSCTGHCGVDADGVWRIPGFLNLRLTADMARLFEVFAFSLVGEPEVTHLSKEYWPWGEEEIAIGFKGAGHGDDQLERSMLKITAFFRQLACLNTTEQPLQEELSL